MRRNQFETKTKKENLNSTLSFYQKDQMELLDTIQAAPDITVRSENVSLIPTSVYASKLEVSIVGQLLKIYDCYTFSAAASAPTSVIDDIGLEFDSVAKNASNGK